MATEPHEQQLLADLANHPGWQVLRTQAREARDTYFGRLAERLYNNPAAITPDDLHYRRGFFRGVFWLLNNPVFTAKALERAAAADRSQEGDTDE